MVIGWGDKRNIKPQPLYFNWTYSPLSPSGRTFRVNPFPQESIEGGGNIGRGAAPLLNTQKLFYVYWLLKMSGEWGLK
jgi:hypothetical protein